MKQLVTTLLMAALLMTGCCNMPQTPVENGVSKQLAQLRKSHITNINYKLFFSVPLSSKEDIMGREDLFFNLKDRKQDLQIDFKESKEHIHKIICNGNVSNFQFTNEHIVIPSSELKKGNNHIHIDFRAGNTSLNRNEEFLYTLFVPDRARTAFPCFDQPNLKATFTLSMDVPTQWVAIANGKLKDTEDKGDLTHYNFETTKPIPTYLFSFVAGKFESITRQHKGKGYTLYHRETNKKKLNNNVDNIFDILFNSLDWLENYTDIKYPFAKYDMIAIPSFQYGGMEHTGATLYKSHSLFLDEGPSQSQLLRRANLIAHETAHMWFGDLVTMKWFDQVWLKEVFANFMADKIVNPMYPKINHDLRFLMTHYPSAYSVDRTRGANPINQKLNNLNNAGTLYGSIIYHKSPIVMQMLENNTSEKILQDGLREYLSKFSYSNATWEDLISILNSKTNDNLKSWSEQWVDQPDRPYITASVECTKQMICNLTIRQKDRKGLHRTWPQKLFVTLGYKDHQEHIPVSINDSVVEVSQAADHPYPLYIILNGKGQGYGYFKIDETSRDFLLKNISRLNDDMLRGVCWINLWENLQKHNVKGNEIIKSIVTAIPTETNELNRDLLLSYLKRCYWNFLTKEQRKNICGEIEKMLWTAMIQTPEAGEKANYFNTLTSIVQTKQMLSTLYKIWNGNQKIKGLHLSDQRMVNLAFQLSLKMEDKADKLLYTQLRRITNPDLKARLNFVLPALSPITEIRDKFFSSLKDPSNREHEPWVTEAVGYLNHPLRQQQALKYMRKSLDLLQEIQKTGDIFFPKSWLSAVYSGHSSDEAARITQQFLKEHPNYPENLKMKILQASNRVLSIGSNNYSLTQVKN